MEVSYNWLKDYVDIDVPPEELVEMLTVAGSEVEGFEEVDGDFCIELEIKSNRADLLGAIGIAREIAAITGKPLKTPPVEFPVDTERAAKLATVEVLDTAGCPRYTARVIRGVKVRPSPEWLVKRLEAVGLRSINNVVDVTNYVLMECSQPLHAFDLDTLADSHVIVRRAQPGEVITTIDDVERKLPAENLVIADAQRPVAVAGVMGGAETEVSNKTTNVLLESAVFDPISVRRTSRALGLLSDSSYRFERGVDPVGAEWASRRACSLIAQLAGGKVAEGFIDVNSIDLSRKEASVRFSRIPRILGITVAPDDAASILRRLEFHVLAQDDEKISVSIPSFRPDVYREIDLIEEIGRIHGYDKIPLKSAMTISVGAVSKFEKCQGMLRGVLAGCGFNEAITSSFLTPQMASTARVWPGEIVSLANPLRVEESALRPCLMPSLLHVKAVNKNRGVARCELFELGTVFTGAMKERPVAGIMEEDGFYALKGVVELLLDRFGLGGSYTLEAFDAGFFKGGHAAKLTCGERLLGCFGEMSARVLNAFDLDRPIWLCELDFDAVVELAVLERTSSGVPKYPAVDRDLAIVLDEAVTWEQVLECVNSLSEPLCESVSFMDVYRGKQIEAGRKSIAFGITYRSPDRTLTGEEVSAAQERLVNYLQEKLNAKLRA